MRKTFRPHPEIKIGGQKYIGSYDHPTNTIILGRTPEPIKTLVHEITHWAMNGLLSKNESIDTDLKYDALRSKLDVLTFFQISIEERTAEYIEELVDE